MHKKADPIVETLGCETIKELFERIKKHVKEEWGEILDIRPQLTDTENPIDVDFSVAHQVGSRSVDHVSALEDASNIIKEHQDMAARTVRMNTKFLDGSLKPDAIISAIKASTFSNFDSGNLIVFYDVKAAGEDSRRPDERKPALRKAHLDRLVKIVLSARSVSGNYEMRPPDFSCLLDAGRHGNALSLTSSLKDDGDKARTPHV
jgi:hypothetical protein